MAAFEQESTRLSHKNGLALLERYFIPLYSIENGCAVNTGQR